MKWTQLYGSSNILWHCPSLGLEQKPNFSSHIASVFQICWHLEGSTLTASSFRILVVQLGFPGGSAGKESACNAGDFGSIPGLGRSTGEGIGYPPQYSRVSLVGQLVKNPPAMWETWVWSLGWEDPLERGKYSLQYSGLENSMDCIVHGVAKSRTWLSHSHFYFSSSFNLKETVNEISSKKWIVYNLK